MKQTIEFNLNGMNYKREVNPEWTLLRFLRDAMNMAEIKECCGKGECGCCSVLLEGVPVRSCLFPACEADGREISTPEGQSFSMPAPFGAVSEFSVL